MVSQFANPWNAQNNIGITAQVVHRAHLTFSKSPPPSGKEPSLGEIKCYSRRISVPQRSYVPEMTTNLTGQPLNPQTFYIKGLHTHLNALKHEYSYMGQLCKSLNTCLYMCEPRICSYILKVHQSFHSQVYFLVDNFVSVEYCYCVMYLTRRSHANIFSVQG